MRKIKIESVILSLIASIGLILTGLIFAQEISSNPLAGKLIALDAGHGGEKLGAQYPANCASDGDTSDCQIYEKDVSLAVVYALKGKLEANGAKVVLSRECNETISSNKERVDTAVEKCKQVDVNGDGSPDGKKCDVLVSVHHNGSADPTYDGTLVIYNENQDKRLAVALHDALISALGLKDEGYDNGGYGMTVYDHLVSAITEAYYITNTNEANLYYSGTLMSVSKYDTSSTCTYEVSFGERINQEADALYLGLVNYFSAAPQKPGNRK